MRPLVAAVVELVVDPGQGPVRAGVRVDRGELPVARRGGGRRQRRLGGAVQRVARARAAGARRPSPPSRCTTRARNAPAERRSDRRRRRRGSAGCRRPAAKRPGGRLCASNPNSEITPSMSISSSGRVHSRHIPGLNVASPACAVSAAGHQRVRPDSAGRGDRRSSPTGECRKRCVRRRSPRAILSIQAPLTNDPSPRHPARARLRADDERRLPVQAPGSVRGARRRHPPPAAVGQGAVRLQAVRDRDADRLRPRGSSTSRRWRSRRCRSSRPSSPAASCCWRSWPSGPSACRSPAGSGSASSSPPSACSCSASACRRSTAPIRSFSVPGMIVFEGVLLVAGTLLIMGPRIGAPAEHHGFMLGAAAGILFGVSDVAIKAISGMVGAHGVLGLDQSLDGGDDRRLGRRLLRVGQGPPGRRRRPGHRRHRHCRQRVGHRRRDPRVRRSALRPPADVRVPSASPSAWCCSPPG